MNGSKHRLGIRVLPALTALAVALISWNEAGSQAGKTPLAKVTVSGKEAGVVTINDGTKKVRFVLVEEDNRTTVKVHTEQDVAKFNEQLLAEHRELTMEFTEKVRKLINMNDFQAVKKAEQEFKAASDELLKHLSYVTAEGTVTVVDGDLQMQGKLRVFAYKGTDKDLGKGRATVEGQATQIKYDAGQGEKLMLAIQNGDKAIVLTGKVADMNLKAQGTIRVLGVLRSGGKSGHAVLEVEKVEELKK